MQICSARGHFNPHREVMVKSYHVKDFMKVGSFDRPIWKLTKVLKMFSTFLEVIDSRVLCLGDSI